MKMRFFMIFAVLSSFQVVVRFYHVLQFGHRSPEVSGIFQSRSVLSRAQMTTLRCVADRIASQTLAHVTKVGCGVGAPPETRRPRPPTPPHTPRPVLSRKSMKILGFTVVPVCYGMTINVMCCHTRGETLRFNPRRA